MFIISAGDNKVITKLQPPVLPPVPVCSARLPVSVMNNSGGVMAAHD